MVTLLFGVSNVGKTVSGIKLSEKLNYTFYDLDEVIKKKFQTTMEEFMKANPFPYEKGKIKGAILSELVRENTEDMVVAVSPIGYSRFFNRILENVIAIEFQDSAENIFDRLVFSDEEDNIYTDDEYKKEHEFYYLQEIYGDIKKAKTLFKKRNK